MSTTEVGALGLDCLKKVEEYCHNSRSLNGKTSINMRRKLARVMDAVNILIFKAEASGGPDAMREKNKRLIVDLERYKIEEIRRKRELDELKSVVQSFRNEVLELGDKLDNR